VKTHPNKLTSEKIRNKTIALSCRTGAGHLAPSLSCVEILTVLFRDFLRFRPGEPRWPGRDRLVFSKGHGAYGYYVILNQLGFIPDRDIDTFYTPASRLKGCLVRDEEFMIEASTGTLGHGLPIAAGMALGFRMRGRENRVVCLVGDGEMQEGSNFEALAMAHRHRLANLMVVVDANGLQAMGRVDEIGLGNTTLAKVLRCYAPEGNFHEVDGHDEEKLRRAMRPFFQGSAAGGITVVFAHTVKGKGIAMMEGVARYHFRCPVQDGYEVRDDD